MTPTPAADDPAAAPSEPHTERGRPVPSAPQPQSGLRIAGGRVYLSLGWPQLTVLLALAVALMWGAFQTGVRSAQPVEETNTEGLDFLSPGAERTPHEDRPVKLTPAHRGAGEVVTPMRGERKLRTSEPPQAVPATEPPPPQAPTLEPGYFYVVAQHFPRSRRQAAEAARDFLRSQGVECIVYDGRGDWPLVALPPFASEREAQGLRQRVRDLGRQYAETGSGYDFSGCLVRRY